MREGVILSKSTPSKFYQYLYRKTKFPYKQIIRSGFRYHTSNKEFSQFIPTRKVRTFTDEQIHEVFANTKLYDNMSMVDKYGFMQSLCKYISKDLRIPPPKIILSAIPFRRSSGFDRKHNTIAITHDILSGNLEMLTSIVAHESRHAWQMRKKQAYTDLKRYFLLKHARITEKTRTGKRQMLIGYATTPDEVDARNYSIQFLKKHNLTIPKEWLDVNQHTIKYGKKLLRGPVDLRAFGIPVLRFSKTYQRVLQNTRAFLRSEMPSSSSAPIYNNRVKALV